MTVRTQRILIIIGFSVFVMGIGALTWILFFKPLFQPSTSTVDGNTNSVLVNGVLPNTNVLLNGNGTSNTTATGPNTLPQLSDIAAGGLTVVTQVTTAPAVAATVASDGQTLSYYNSVKGIFERLNPKTGTTSLLSAQKFPDVQGITWSPDRAKAVLEFPDDRKIVYDFGKEKQYTLPSDTAKFSFSPDSNRIAYAYSGDGVNNQLLVVSDLDGQNAKAIQRLADKADQVQVAWSPSSDVVALFHEGTNAEQQQVILIGQNQENFKGIQTDGRGFNGKWTPDGSKLLYTVYSTTTNWNPELHLVNARGDLIGQGNTDLGLATFVDKCAFSRLGTTAYCGVPDALDRGSGIYPEFSYGVKDTFYSVDLATGAVRPVAQPVSRQLDRYTVVNPFLSDDQSILYFTDRGTGRLISIRLK